MTFSFFLFSLQNGLNALHLAAKEGHTDLVEELLERGAPVDSSTKVHAHYSYYLTVGYSLIFSFTWGGEI